MIQDGTAVKIINSSIKGVIGLRGIVEDGAGVEIVVKIPSDSYPYDYIKTHEANLEIVDNKLYADLPLR